MNEKTSKKASRPQHAEKSDELRPEYRFDYSKARPNRFASSLKGDAVVVVLEPDVAEKFRTQREVNAVLRAVMQPKPASHRQKAG